MAVCISALCMGGDGTPCVIGASDRMITVGDVQFEPQVTKIFQLTSSIYALTSGESSVNAEIMNAASVAINARLEKDKTWMTIAEAAQIVGRQVQAYTLRMGDLEVLVPLGLTREAFLRLDRTHWFKDAWDRLFAIDSGTDIIVAGVDETGAHIWKVDGKGKPWCHDPAAFAAIGIGQRHAESQFQFSNHNRAASFEQTLFLTYKAKRRAEVAPGVGRIFTDMCIVPGLGGLTQLAYADIVFLRVLYDSLQDAEGELAQKHDAEMRLKFQQLADAAMKAATKADEQKRQTSI